MPLEDFSVLAFKSGHDGCMASVSGGRLVFAMEAEKDNEARFAPVGPLAVIKALERCAAPPRVIAHSGWSKGGDPAGQPVGGGYLGLDTAQERESGFAGFPCRLFFSSHERSHLMCAYGLSPFKQGEPCYALIWEGHLGAIYFIDADVGITRIGEVLRDPGVRYAFLYGLADPAFDLPRGAIRLSDAGKLMALAAYADGQAVCAQGHALVARLLDPAIEGRDLCKQDFSASEFHDIGVTHPGFANLAALFSNRLHERFQQAVEALVPAGALFLIGGGCGLNCEWNSRWRDSGRFAGVFVPPCTNDSGSAIGTAVDAMFHYTGHAKLEWQVYAGEAPVRDVSGCAGFVSRPYLAADAARLLAQGKVLGWMQGRYEMGPRALGARSILAAPYPRAMLERLNRIKGRENFRPIAPICLEEEMGLYFSSGQPSPYMLEFRRVISDAIPAATHVDRSARPQSVNAASHRGIHELLTAFRMQSGIGVLCNTSLNFNGAGFINTLSDLGRFALAKGLDGFVFESELFLAQ
jgi:hydroxymethyl cephem carbamoyltransferase